MRGRVARMSRGARPRTYPEAVSEQQPPPRVTIRDPSSPSRARDVLVSQPAGPRCRRGWFALVGVVLLLAVSALASSRTSPGRPSAQARELLAAAEVAVTTDRTGGRDDRAEVNLDLQLRNLGPVDLHLLGVGLDAPGWGTAEAPSDLPAGTNVRLRLTHRWECGPREQLPTLVRLEVEVTGGARGPVTASLDHDGADGLAQRRAGTCGDLDVAQALQVGRSSAVLSNRQVRLDVELLNRSIYALMLRSPRVAGFDITGAPAFSVRLAGRRPGSPAGLQAGTTLHLGLTVTHCPAGPATADLHLPLLGLDLLVSGHGGSAHSLQYVDGLTELLHQLEREQCGRA